MAESNSFNLFCLHEKVPEKVSKKKSLIKTEVLIFTKFVDDKTPPHPQTANVFSKCLYTVTVISKTDVLNHNTVSSHSLRMFAQKKRHKEI